MRKNPFNTKTLPLVSALPGNNTSVTSPSLLNVEAPQSDKDDEKYDIGVDELKRMIDRLTIRKEDWTMTHPSGLTCTSDKYYADLANIIILSLTMLKMPLDCPKDLVRTIAMTVSAYLEDIVSGTGVWEAIRNMYKKKYGKWLPFYDCDHDEYLLDNVNIEDVRFLVWQSFCRCGQPERTIYSPLSQGVEKISEIVYDIIVDRFEYAPEAKRAADYIDKVFRKDNYFQVRELAEWLVLKNPLTSARNMYGTIVEEALSLNSSHKTFDKELCLYYIKCIKSWSENIGPFGCPASGYLAEMCRLRGNETLAAKLDNLQVIPFAAFRVKEVGKEKIVLQDASGEEYDVAKNSFAPKTKFREIKGFLTSIVKYGELWQQNGVATGLEEDPLKIKDEIALYHRNEKSRQHMREIIQSHGGRRIFYCKDKEEVASVMGIPYRGKPEDEDVPDNYVLMLSDSEEPILLAGYAVFFKDKDNPFYNKKEASRDSLEVVLDGRIPDDIACIIEEKHLLPDISIYASQGKKLGKAIAQDNMRFLLGFYRSKNPELTRLDEG